jgi:AcrR family transcriptional regulator
MEKVSSPDTKQRLLAAASELFAERGFAGATMRQVAQRAGVNLAAGNYHYGSKKELYLEVLRAMFAAIRSELARRGAAPPAQDLARRSRADLEAVLAARVRAMLTMLLGPPPSLHGALMQREMTDPSEALSVIVDEFMRPMLEETEDLLGRLAPELDRQARRQCAFSLIGQVVFYRFAMPGLLQMSDWPVYPAGFAEQLAAHITSFSLGGLERRTANRRKQRRGGIAGLGVTRMAASQGRRRS